MPELTLLPAIRYVQPLREGGSLPAVVDTEDGLWVAKFRGSGQGAGALVAELIAALLARALGLPVPDVTLLEIAPEFGQGEPDPEIQDLLRASHGVNMGLRYLDGAFNFDVHAAGELVSPELAAEIVWFDALITNPDRTHRNPNLLVWERRPWLIDHGSALHAHHDWERTDEARMRTRFPLIRTHVLLAAAGDIGAADARLAPRLEDEVLGGVLAAVPEALLLDPIFARGVSTGAAARARYHDYLRVRLTGPRGWVEEAVAAQDAARRESPQRRAARR
ncbi:MAG TPA: HipA family kinase [Longimicrobiales bacterium]|nr:HipA family kinase [Longimicrobiales bacterium]